MDHDNVATNPYFNQLGMFGLDHAIANNLGPREEQIQAMCAGLNPSSLGEATMMRKMMEQCVGQNPASDIKDWDEDLSKKKPKKKPQPKVQAPPPLPPTRQDIPNGSLVSIHGLVAKPELNGLTGKVMSFVPSSSRYEIAVSGSVETYALKTANFTVTKTKKHFSIAEVQAMPDEEYHEWLMKDSSEEEESDGELSLEKRDKHARIEAKRQRKVDQRYGGARPKVVVHGQDKLESENPCYHYPSEGTSPVLVISNLGNCPDEDGTDFTARAFLGCLNPL